MSNIKIGIIGDYDPTKHHHPLTTEAIHHSANHLGLTVQVEWLPTPTLARTDMENQLAQFDALVASSGSPYLDKNGALNAIRFARERGLPFLGT